MADIAKKKHPAQWQSGQSGNPKGRPPGVGKVARLRQAIANDLPKIIEGLVQAAKGGDIQAAATLLRHSLPPLRAEALPVALPLGANSSLVEKANAILAATGEGEISPDTAAHLIRAVATLGQVIETQELAARLEALENLIEQRGQP